MSNQPLDSKVILMTVKSNSNAYLACMVKIKLNEIRIDGPLAVQIADTKLNDAAGIYTKELTAYLHGKRCELHPKMNQEITVTVDRTQKLIMEKGYFCCDRFKESIQFVPSN